MNAINHHNAVVIIENQRVVVDKSLQPPVKLLCPAFFGKLLQHFVIEVKNKRRMETEIPLRLLQIFEITDNHLFLHEFSDR